MRTSSIRRPSALGRLQGFSLVELMVGLVIGLIGILVMMQVFSLADRQQRVTTSGTDAQTTGVMAAFTLERELRSAGFGRLGLNCTRLWAHRSGASPSTVELQAAAVKITPGTQGGNDQLQIGYPSGSLAAVPVTLQQDMAEATAPLRIDSDPSFKTGDMVVITPRAVGECSTLEVTGAPTKTSDPNVAGAMGFQWDLPHTTGTVFPAGGYFAQANVVNLGALTVRNYFIQDATLMMRNALVPSSVPVVVARGIIALRAQYGLDANGDGQLDSWSNAPADPKQIIAVRFALVARGDHFEKGFVTATPLTLWDNGPMDKPQLALSAEQRHYRYKVYQTIVPLRNVIWGYQ
ncbi:MAG: type pilus assembly protein PilW [Burkholderiales bacterium]